MPAEHEHRCVGEKKLAYRLNDAPCRWWNIHFLASSENYNIGVAVFLLAQYEAVRCSKLLVVMAPTKKHLGG